MACKILGVGSFGAGSRKGRHFDEDGGACDVFAVPFGEGLKQLQGRDNAEKEEEEEEEEEEGAAWGGEVHLEPAAGGRDVDSALGAVAGRRRVPAKNVTKI